MHTHPSTTSTHSRVEGGVEAANTHDHQGRTAGHLAATYGHADLLEVLLERGVNVGAVDSNGQTLMHNSVHSTACLNIALRMADAAIINQADSEGFTAMHYAVSGKELEAIKAIVGASGVNVGQTDADGRTALHWACAVGDADIARVLIANGASIASVDVGNTTPLEYAVLEDHVDCVTVVTTGDGASVAAHQDGEGRTPLIQAAGVGATASITTLLQLPNLADFLPLQGFDGRSALHVAAFNQIVDSTVEIWTAGGDLDAQDGAGETPVMIAASGGGGVLLALHSAGAVPDVRVVDLTGMTALHHAATAGNADEVGVLLGWDSGQLPMVDERGETGETQFHRFVAEAALIGWVGHSAPATHSLYGRWCLTTTSLAMCLVSETITRSRFFLSSPPPPSSPLRLLLWALLRGRSDYRGRAGIPVQGLRSPIIDEYPR
jgi:ankyrin repeat protein